MSVERGGDDGGTDASAGEDFGQVEHGDRVARQHEGEEEDVEIDGGRHLPQIHKSFFKKESKIS